MSSGVSPRIPQLIVRTELSDSSETPLALIDDPQPLLFQRLGQGLAGAGEVARKEFSGPDRFVDAHRWWSEICSLAQIDDPLQRAGTGLVSFGTFTFSPESSDSSLMVIPATIIGQDSEGTWRTDIAMPEGYGHASSRSGGKDKQPHWNESGPSEDAAFIELVGQALDEISSQQLNKVVIARKVDIGVSGQPQWRRILRALAEAYPDTFVFQVDGFFGASPETLASVRGSSLSLRVLAGSAPRGTTPESDRNKADALITSSKDLDEHRFAVESVLESLSGQHIDGVADELPFALKLPNLWHLATDVIAALPESFNALSVLEAVHPTAAVAGSPKLEALRFIRENEGIDRGRYAGPVGWIDSRGDGDWALGVRSGSFNPSESTFTAYAGAGIVADSNPGQEWLETELKLRPIQTAISDVSSGAES